jgi:hypothetical protein
MPQGDRFCGSSAALTEGVPEVAPIGAGVAAGAGAIGAAAVGAEAGGSGVAAAGADGAPGGVAFWADTGCTHVISAKISVKSAAASVHRTLMKPRDAMGRATRRWSLCIMKSLTVATSSATPHTIAAETVRQK